MSGLPPREKRKGTPLSYPDGLVSVIERTIRDAPIGTKRLNHGAAHSYLASIGITASKEHKRMVKLCIKSTRTKTQRQVRKLRIEWTSQIQNVNGETSSNRAEKAASATVLLHRLEAVDAMITAVMATRKAVEKQVETTLDNTKKANQYLCDVEPGDTVWIQLLAAASGASPLDSMAMQRRPKYYAWRHAYAAQVPNAPRGERLASATAAAVGRKAFAC